MNTPLRKKALAILAGLALAGSTAFVLFTSTAIAAPAVANAPVNVRSGPGPSYGVIDQLRRGERVDVGRCSGSFCEVSYADGDGWVSSSFLSRSGGGGRPGEPDVGLGVTIGPGGVSVGIGVGEPYPPVRRPPPPRPPVIEPTYGEVCFFERSGYRGDSFCIEEGESIRNLDDWAYRIGSIRNSDGLNVRVCTNTNFRGSCRTYTSSSRSLGSFEGEIASARAD